MILSLNQAVELGEALLDAVENVLKTRSHHEVVFLGGGSTAVAVPLDTSSYMLDSEGVAVIVTD